MPKKISDLTINNTPAGSDVIPYSNGAAGTDRGLQVSYFDTRIDALQDAQSAGVIGYATKAVMEADVLQDDGTLALVTNDPTTANNGWYRWDGTGDEWVASAGFFSAATVQSWAISEAYEASNIVFDSNGIIESANLTWPDGTSGTISNVTNTNGFITQIRYNYSTKWVQIAITYIGDNVGSTTWTSNGF